MTRAMSAALAGVLLMLTACGEDAPAAARPGDQLRSATRGLCDATDLASEGRVGMATDVFDAETHAYLHHLAADLQTTNPEAAADLLEAKQRVEAVLAEGGPPGEARDLLAELQAALRDAAAAAGLRAAACGAGG
jgi:hypothetical protein